MLALVGVRVGWVGNRSQLPHFRLSHVSYTLCFKNVFPLKRLLRRKYFDLEFP